MNTTKASRSFARVQVTHNSAGDSCARANLAALLSMLTSMRNYYHHEPEWLMIGHRNSIAVSKCQPNIDAKYCQPEYLKNTRKGFGRAQNKYLRCWRLGRLRGPCECLRATDSSFGNTGEHQNGTKAEDPVLQHTWAGLRVEDRGEERDHRGGGVCCVPICTADGREEQGDRKRRTTANVKYFAAPIRVDQYESHVRVAQPEKNSLASYASCR
jgi:hypothetical protein